MSGAGDAGGQRRAGTRGAATGRRRRALAALALATLVLPAAARAADDSRPAFPATLTDVDGGTVDVAALAATGRLIVVTLKAAWCPVCREQLVRLREILPRLRSCGARFLVLGPGPADELRAIARDTAFPGPFVEDQGLVLARAFGLVLAPDQIAPAILGVGTDRRIAWAQRGRSAAAYGDEELLERLECGPLGIARAVVDHAYLAARR